MHRAFLDYLHLMHSAKKTNIETNWEPKDNQGVQRMHQMGYDDVRYYENEVGNIVRGAYRNL
jgi:hypothetical protein